MSRALVVLGATSLLLVAIQLNILSSFRLLGVVVMLVWLWPFCVGLVAPPSIAMTTGGLVGLYIDLHVTTPFGLDVLLGVAIAYLANRLMHHNVIEFSGGAPWVFPAVGAAVGVGAPLVFVLLATIVFDLGPWSGSVLASMLVNGVVFALLLWPLTRALAALTGHTGRAA